MSQSLLVAAARRLLDIGCTPMQAARIAEAFVNGTDENLLDVDISTLEWLERQTL